jgi:acetyltransferase-like isoleucine patch superfamily enzyme
MVINKDKLKPFDRLLAKFRYFLLWFIPLIVFSIGFIPLITSIMIIFNFLTFYKILDFILLPFIIYIEFVILVFSQILISGVIIRIFNIKYYEGTYEYTFENKVAFKWMLICQLYTPIRKIFEIIPMGRIQKFYLKLIGMKIGKNTLVGGTIKDPCVTELGKNTTIGEYAVVYAHIHNYEKGTITIKKVKIGDNCIIGAGAIVMPGVKMEDNSILGAGGLVPKNHILKKGKIYIGNPLKEIKKNNTK